MSLGMKRWSSEVIWQMLVGIAVACLTLITAVVVRREFVVSDTSVRVGSQAEASSRAAPRTVEPPVPIEDWERVSRTGHRIGPKDAKLTIVVFSDFECPFCAKFATQVLPALQKTFPGDVAMLFRHWPLPNHKWAYSAARASECAASQGRFPQFHDALFASQKAIGTTTFVDFARKAGVPNIVQFEKCVGSNAPLISVDTDVAEAKRIGGKGTPTIVINGLRLRPPYSPEAISEYIRKALATNTP